jgi:acetyltransferase-like isoleucine patch superfamily enzyme
MKTGRLYIYNLLTKLLPETSFFGLKARLLRWCGADIGSNVRICSSVTILGAGTLKIGDNTWVGHKSLIIASGAISIGKNVDIAPLVYIGTGTHKVDFAGERCAGQGISKDITVGDGCWLCVRSVLLPGVAIGAMSIVGAGALVTKSFPERITAVGIPAKILEHCSTNPPL